MPSLDAITAACKQAIADEVNGCDWQYAYSETVDPRSVLELVMLLDRQKSLPSSEELRALGKMIRDLTGYLRFKGGATPDPVREDLVQQANQLLGLTEL